VLGWIVRLRLGLWFFAHVEFLVDIGGTGTDELIENHMLDRFKILSDAVKLPDGDDQQKDDDAPQDFAGGHGSFFASSLVFRKIPMIESMTIAGPCRIRASKSIESDTLKLRAPGVGTGRRGDWATPRFPPPKGWGVIVNYQG
jgi:hypothetical protein